MMTPTPTQQAEALWIRAHEHVRRGDFANAVRDLAACFKILQQLGDPRLPEVHRRWTEVHALALEDAAHQKAARATTTTAAAASAPAQRPTLEAEAEAAANTGDLEGAIGLLERALAERPDNELVRERLAELTNARARARELGATVNTDDSARVAEEAARRAAAEEEARRAAAEEEARRAAAEEEARRAAEEKARRAAAEEEARRAAAEEAARRAAEEEARRAAEEKARRAAAEEEARRAAAEEAARRAAEEEARRAAAEEEARRAAEEEARRAAEEEARRAAAEEEARRAAEEEARRAAEEEARRAAAEEEARRAAEEARLAEAARLADEARLAEEARAEDARLAALADAARAADPAAHLDAAEAARLAVVADAAVDSSGGPAHLDDAEAARLAAIADAAIDVELASGPVAVAPAADIHSLPTLVPTQAEAGLEPLEPEPFKAASAELQETMSGTATPAEPADAVSVASLDLVEEATVGAGGDDGASGSAAGGDDGSARDEASLELETERPIVAAGGPTGGQIDERELPPGPGIELAVDSADSRADSPVMAPVVAAVAPPMAAEDAPVGMPSLDVQIDMGEMVSADVADELPVAIDDFEVVGDAGDAGDDDDLAAAAPAGGATTTDDGLPDDPVALLETLLARVQANRRAA